MNILAEGKIYLCPDIPNGITSRKPKGAQDAKRAAAFTKIAKELIVAVKEGGSADPAYNSRLATVITKAKAANMPNDNIKRCLEKAAGAGGDNYETITYEGYGPGGVAVIVETMTDNRNRTAGSMRHHFDKFGGNLGATGCVSWSFDKKGVLVIDNEDGDYEEDQVMMDAMDCGADDFEAEDDVFTVYTDPDDFNAVADAMTQKGYSFVSAQIEMVPPELPEAHRPGADLPDGEAAGHHGRRRRRPKRLAQLGRGLRKNENDRRFRRWLEPAVSLIQGSFQISILDFHCKNSVNIHEFPCPFFIRAIGIPVGEHLLRHLPNAFITDFCQIFNFAVAY